MKTRHLLAALLAAATLAPAAAEAADVGVSVSVGQPGFYGRIDIGNFPQPQFIYAEPMIAMPGRPGPGRPLYLHVPPGHAKNWAKHCHKYGACYQPVYFVQERWYQDVYVPRYREQHPGDRREGYRRDDGQRRDGYRRDDDQRRDGYRRDDDQRRGDARRQEDRRFDRDGDGRDRRGPERQAQGRPDKDRGNGGAHDRGNGGKGNGGGKGKGRDD